MMGETNLKQIERKAFRSTYQDGLWDIFLGIIVISMAIYIYRPESGYSAANIITFVLIYTVVYNLFMAGKRYITLPRMGQVRFGSIRQQKKKTMAIILGIIVLIQVAVVGLTASGWLSLVLGEKLFRNLNPERMAVAALGSLFVGLPMLIMAYLNDFPRGYYIAVMMALAVYLMILINQPIYPIVIGGLIIIPGLLHFICFLRKYPIPRRDDQNE